jgi:hypothetical protein
MSLGFEILQYTWHIDSDRPIVPVAKSHLDGKIMVLEEIVVRFVTVPHVPFRRLPIETYLHICAKISEFGISFLGNRQIYSADDRGALRPTSVRPNLVYQSVRDVRATYIHPEPAFFSVWHSNRMNMDLLLVRQPFYTGKNLVLGRTILFADHRCRGL